MSIFNLISSRNFYYFYIAILWGYFIRSIHRLTMKIITHFTKFILALLVVNYTIVFCQNEPYLFLKNNNKLSLPRKENARRVLLNSKPGELNNVLIYRDGTTKVKTIDLTEQVNLIVEMKDKPFFLQHSKSDNLTLRKSAYKKRFAQFRSDLLSLQQSSSRLMKIQLAAPTISREFYKIFYGVAVKVPRAMVSKIEALPYVKKVHIDKRISAVLDQSVHQIRADSVWSKYGTEGDSIVVGILDTGIDYMHPALGGGFGPGFKVIGGYDLENDDPDPLDDHGHGTHVAGIVAADGAGLRGVAPHAKLMAFKVIDQYGWGSESVIIDGIEQTTDPNNDDDSRDKVDIVNMSLGGEGNPNDALSTAVDNAVMIGVTFCIAAGNSYDYRSIGSPGTARLAITVGAVDSGDVIAPFSSKGPNPRIFSIKPDVVAPGVDIVSSVLEQYRKKDEWYFDGNSPRRWSLCFTQVYT